MATTTMDVKPDIKFTLKKTSVFDAGVFTVKIRKVETSDPSSPPKDLLVFAPTTKGLYPVTVFLHGFALSVSFYNELLKHIASHGYIVVAPQLYNLLPHSLPCSGFNEIESTTAVTDWLLKGLQLILPEKVEGNLLQLALIGHSRGGKTAFSLALDPSKTSLVFSVLIGIDPVAGFSKGTQIKPEILTYQPHSLDVGCPVMIVGTGLGDVKLNCMLPPCAPNGMNHKEFYYEAQSPCYHFVTKDYGHMDMLDDELNIQGKLAVCVCKTGKGNKEPMRRCVGGLVVAFLETYLDGNSENLDGILSDPNIAPVTLSPIEYMK